MLRQRLEERARAGARQGAKRGGSPQPQVGGIRALAAVEGVEDRQLRRALVQNILAEQFGSDLINDAKFQQVVEGVLQTIDQDAACGGLMDQAVLELRSAAR